MQEAAIYLRHELEAHALAYKAIKALPGALPKPHDSSDSRCCALSAVNCWYGHLGHAFMRVSRKRRPAGSCWF